MPRRNVPSRRRAEPDSRPIGGGGAERSEDWRGEEYRVRSVSGANSIGPYRCPGCDQVLAAGIAHVVAWPAADLAAADRRHWHAGCWRARGSRGPGIQRSRNAPRYG
jgi:hypothetical protein